MKSRVKCSRGAGLALPDDDHPKAHFSELSALSYIAQSVRRDLGEPKWAIPLRNCRASTLSMPVPEAPVNEDRPTLAQVREIGRTWQVATVESVADPGA